MARECRQEDGRKARISAHSGRGFPDKLPAPFYENMSGFPGQIHGLVPDRSISGKRLVFPCKIDAEGISFKDLSRHFWVILPGILVRFSRTNSPGDKTHRQIL